MDFNFFKCSPRKDENKTNPLNTVGSNIERTASQQLKIVTLCYTINSDICL